MRNDGTALQTTDPHPFRLAAQFIEGRPGAETHPILSDEDIERLTDRVYERLHRNGRGHAQLLYLDRKSVV